jgi:adenylate cyclase
VTVLFADLRGFTRFAEGRKPEEAVQILNIYLQTIATVVLERRGTLDKFTGDGVMAVFGAPAALPEHARAALSCAADILQGVGRLNQARRQNGETTLEVGLGIATGDALVGNIGCTTRMDYTAIGDVVNLAARLEKEAHPGEAVITLETVEEPPLPVAAGLCDDFRARGELRTVEPIMVRGRTEPVRVVVFVTAVTEKSCEQCHN